MNNTKKILGAAAVVAGAHTITKQGDKIRSQGKRLAALEAENKRISNLGPLNVSVRHKTTQEEIVRYQKAIRGSWKKEADKKRVEMCNKYSKFLRWPLEITDDLLPYMDALLSEIQAELSEDPVIADEFRIVGIEQLDGLDGTIVVGEDKEVQITVRRANSNINALLKMKQDNVIHRAWNKK